MTRWIRIALAVVLAGGFAMLQSAVFQAPRAEAACHVAAFEESAYSVAEDDGSVTVTVFLQGRQAQCAGSVLVRTRAGAAKAPEDYEAVSRTLCFETGDDREEDVEIAVVDDVVAEGDEAFTVEIADANDPACQPDNITGSASTTVTIVDDDAVATQPPQTQPPQTQAPQTQPPTPTPDAPTPSPAVSPDATSTLSPSPTALAAPDDEDDGSNAGLVAAAVGAVAVAGAGTGLVLWRRRLG